MRRGEDEARGRPQVVSDGYSVRFSLIIATKGRPTSLWDALESSARGLRSDCEVIVVDGDPEGSAETVVRGVGNRYPEMAIRYVASEPGAALQRNVGIDLARCDVVVFIDDDCTVEPGLFEVLTSAYGDPSVVGATGRIYGPSCDRLGSDPHSRLRWLLLGGGRQGSMTSFGFRRPIIDVEQPRNVQFMPGPFMSARRDLAAEVRFDERLAAYSLGEDDDFSYRLSRHGRIRYEPSAVVCHQELGWRHMDRRQMDCLQVVNRTYRPAPDLGEAICRTGAWRDRPVPSGEASGSRASALSMSCSENSLLRHRRTQPTWPTPVRPLVAIGTPPAQSISRDFRVFASVVSVVRTLRVAVSITSPESPTYTNRPSRECWSQPSWPQSYAHGLSVPLSPLTRMTPSCVGATPWETPETS
jgi:GT2 family glycosyltransferase